MTGPTFRAVAAATLFAATAAVAVALTGCQPKPAASAEPSPAPAIAQAQPNPQPPAAAAVQAEAPEASRGTAEALALKAQNWAKEMEPVITRRTGGKGDPAATELPNPEDFRIGPAPAPKRRDPQPQVVPVVETAVNNTPSMPNQTATLTVPDKAAAAPAAGGAVATASASANAANRLLADSPADRVAPPARAVPKDTGPSAGELDTSLSRNLRDYPRDVWTNLDFQLLQFLKDKPTPQLDALAKLTTEDRELIAALLDGLTNFRNAIRSDNNMLMSRKVRPLLDLADRLRAQADLVIPTLALCTRVDGFGVYEPVEPARFTSMREHPVIVYCEVENFASILTEKKLWETRLSQEVVLYTETGLPIWKDKTENIPDLARNRRHDFFVVKKTKFPGNIAVGRYLLKVTIVDQQASRVAEATVPVQFVAQ